MTAIIVIVLICWFTSALIRSAESKRQARQQARIRAEQQKQKDAQARIREELRQQREDSREWARQQVEIQREQIRLAQEQEKQAREQARQAEQLAKHEERIARLEFDMMQAQADIETERERINGLYALLDIAEANQAAATPGSKADEAAQRKIITLTGQIAAAEKRIRKAEYTKAAAEKKLAA